MRLLFRCLPQSGTECCYRFVTEKHLSKQRLRNRGKVFANCTKTRQIHEFGVFILHIFRLCVKMSTIMHSGLIMRILHRKRGDANGK